MQSLIFLPFPLPEESPTSLIKRFATRHGCSTLVQLLALGLPASSYLHCLSQNAAPTLWLAERAGEYTDRLMSGFYTPLGIDGTKRHCVHGLAVSNRILRWAGTGFCSECCNEGREYFIKDFKLSVNCPYHNRRYLFHCPNCQKKLRWLAPIENKCRCGAILVSPKCSELEAAPEQFLRKIFLDREQEKFDYLSKTLTALRYNWRNPAAPSSRLIFEAAISIINQDTRGLVQYLHRLHELHPHLDKEVICGSLATVRCVTSNDAMAEFHRSSPLIPRSQRDSKDTGYAPFTLTITQLRRALALYDECSDALKLRIPYLKGVFKRSHVFNEKQIIEIFSETANFRHTKQRQQTEFDALDLRSVARRLDITFTYLKRIVSAGLLTVTKHGQSVHLIDTNQLNEFSATVETVRALSLRAKKSEYSIKRSMRVLNILPIASPGMRFSTLISKNDADRIWAHNPRRPVAKSRNCPSYNGAKLQRTIASGVFAYPTAANETHLDRPTLRALVRAGYLQPEPDKVNGCIVFSREHLQRINDTFITPTACAKLLDINITIVSEIVIRLGLVPVTGPMHSRSTTILFKLAEVQALLKAESRPMEQTLSIKEAAQILHLTHKSIFNLIACGEISTSGGGQPSRLFASAARSSEFHATHVNAEIAAKVCGVRVQKIKNFLSQLGVKTICPPRDICERKFYRVSDLSKVGIPITDYLQNHYPKDTRHTSGTGVKGSRNVATFLENLTPAGVICKKWNIPPSTFKKHFINTGFLHPVTPRKGVHYLTPEDKNKIVEFISNHYSLRMADSIVGQRNYFRTLLTHGTITEVANIPSELNGQLYILRTDVELALDHLDKSAAIYPR